MRGSGKAGQRAQTFELRVFLDTLSNSLAALSGDSALAGYHLLHSVRGDLLMRLGNFPEAREEIQRAIAMTQNIREQELLTKRLKQMEKAAPST